MENYSEKNVFSAKALKHFELAKKIIELVPNIENIRCHELARIVYNLLEDKEYTFVIDGRFAIAEHSWIKIGLFVILDVYSVGSLPQVQLIDEGLTGKVSAYVSLDMRKDIDAELINYLTGLIRCNLRTLNIIEQEKENQNDKHISR